MVQDRGYNVDQLVGIPEDANGIDTTWLEKKLQELEIGKNKSPKSPYYSAVLYTVPTYSNPSGTILSHERRQKLVKLARQHDVLVICDDVYDMLYQNSTSKPPPPLIAYDMEESTTGLGNVISNGTFSKILSPGVRCGWVQARSGLIKRLANRHVVLDSVALQELAINRVAFQLVACMLQVVRLLTLVSTRANRYNFSINHTN
jgi:DNA-binding transcriptional MocR family regulator